MITSLIFPDITLLQEIDLLTFTAVDYTLRMVQESPSPEQSELRDSGSEHGSGLHASRGIPCLIAGTIYHPEQMVNDQVMLNCQALNLTTTEGEFPGCGLLLSCDLIVLTSAWKIADVVPIPKVKPVENISKHPCPISLTSAV